MKEPWTLSRIELAIQIGREKNHNSNRVHLHFLKDDYEQIHACLSKYGGANVSFKHLGINIYRSEFTVEIHKVKKC